LPALELEKTSSEIFVFDGHRYALINAWVYETEALATEAEAETKAFSVETEAKTKMFSLEAKARPRRLKFQPRRDRAESLLHLETASRPRCQDRGHILARLFKFSATVKK